MNSVELANKVMGICVEAKHRILGVGDDQYNLGFEEGQSGERQRHEDESLDDHLLGLEEELLDCINWSAMTILKIREAREKAHRAIEAAGDTKEELSGSRGLGGEDSESTRSSLADRSNVPSDLAYLREDASAKDV